jgi:NADH-quinone oxidoreductase subunit C
MLSLFKTKSSLYIEQIRLFFQPLFVYQVEGELYLKVNRKEIKKLLFFLRYHTQTLYKQLIDVYGVDYVEKLNRFEICYNLLSLDWNHRVTITVSVSDRQFVESISDLYPNALWYEREAYDMFGVIFHGNKDLRRILTDYGFKGHPLRKDFPLSGYTEVRYDDFSKRLRYEKVSLAQEYRVFTLETPGFSR